jgi:hypothetical protein
MGLVTSRNLEVQMASVVLARLSERSNSPQSDYPLPPKPIRPGLSVCHASVTRPNDWIARPFGVRRLAAALAIADDWPPGPAESGIEPVASVRVGGVGASSRAQSGGEPPHSRSARAMPIASAPTPNPAARGHGRRAVAGSFGWVSGVRTSTLRVVRSTAGRGWLRSLPPTR